MALTLEINYEGSNDLALGPYGNTLVGQTFTTVGAFTLTKFGFYGYEIGSIPADSRFEIYNTAAGLPTGAALSSNVYHDLIDGSTQWQEFELTDPIALSAATQYAWVLNNPSGNSTSRPIAYADTSSPAYAGGSYVQSTNGGSSWSANSGRDFNFRLYSGSGYVDMTGTSSLTFTPTGTLDLIRTLTGTSSLTFTSTGVLTYGALTGSVEEKYKNRLVAFGNDLMYYENV